MNAQMLMIGALALTLAPAAASAAGGKPTANSSQTNTRVAQGQPSQDCEALVESGMGSTPGHSADSPGSAFNPAGNAGSHYAGEQPQNSKNSASVSQYDVACLHGTR